MAETSYANIIKTAVCEPKQLTELGHTVGLKIGHTEGFETAFFNDMVTSTFYFYTLVRSRLLSRNQV
jgi:hypothetical protein